MTKPLDRPVAWITGAGGLIGNYLVQAAPENSAVSSVVGLTREQLDLFDFPAAARRFNQEKPFLVIHCAAMSKSPACQAQPDLARKLNVEVTRFLSGIAVDATFVFLSSDLVFDGRKGNYVESDAPNPLSTYAETKVAGEEIVALHPRHLIIRTSLNGGRSPTGDRGFNEELVSAWRAGKAVSLFEDEFRSPIAAGETARAVWELIARGGTGIYHVAGAERLSRLQIGELLAARWASLRPQIRRASLHTYSGARRAPDTSLNCARAQKLLSFALPGLTDWLAANPNEPF